jgi:hypothetical protein
MAADLEFIMTSWPRAAADTSYLTDSDRVLTRPGGGHPRSGGQAWPVPGLPELWVAQGDHVGLGDIVGLDSPQSGTEAPAGLPEELEGVGGGVLRSGAIGISPVLLDEMGLQGGSDFVGCLQRVVDSPVPCGVVNHTASILAARYVA